MKSQVTKALYLSKIPGAYTHLPGPYPNYPYMREVKRVAYIFQHLFLKTSMVSEH